jgi:ABC-2 type transport system permease protein
MRALLFSGVVRADYLARAAALDVLWLVLGAAAFFWAFRNARRRGALLQMGE